MTSILNSYPAYKPSSVHWLGDVPEHWDVRRLRNVLTGTTERNRRDLPLLSVVRERGVILRDITNVDENHNFVPYSLRNVGSFSSLRWCSSSTVDLSLTARSPT